MKKKFGLAGLVVLMVMLALGAAAEEGNTIIIGCDMYAPYTYKNGTGEFVGRWRWCARTAITPS